MDAEPDRRLRPLRLLPADLPDLRALARGDGLAARPDLADEGDARGDGRAERDGRRALRPLPRLHGLPHLVPVGRPVRPADRARARARRAGGAAPARRAAAARARLRRLPAPPTAQLALRFCRCRRPAPFRPLKELAPRWREARRAARRDAGRGERRSPASACSPAASSRSLFGEVNRASARVLAAYGYEVAAPYDGCCGALALHAGRREQGSSSRARQRPRSPPPAAR